MSTPTTEKRLTENERDALVRLLTNAQETNVIPSEDRALIVRAKAKLEQMLVQKGVPRSFYRKEAIRWE